MMLFLQQLLLFASTYTYSYKETETKRIRINIPLTLHRHRDIETDRQTDGHRDRSVHKMLNMTKTNAPTVHKSKLK